MSDFKLPDYRGIVPVNVRISGPEGFGYCLIEDKTEWLVDVEGKLAWLVGGEHRLKFGGQIGKQNTDENC